MGFRSAGRGSPWHTASLTSCAGSLRVDVGRLGVAGGSSGGASPRPPSSRRRSGSDAPLVPSLHLAQHPDEYRPERPILLAVDQQFGEGAALRVGPELPDPLDAVEVGQHQDVKEFGAGSRSENVPLCVPIVVLETAGGCADTPSINEGKGSSVSGDDRFLARDHALARALAENDERMLPRWSGGSTRARRGGRALPGSSEFQGNWS